MQETIADADTLIDGLIVPPIGQDLLDSSAIEPLSGILDDYNNGLFPDGPPSCDDLEGEEEEENNG